MEELKLKIFFSYSHKDEAYCIDLQKHLKPLKRAELISHWYDRELDAGDNWDESIKTQLLNADIILFLISPDFLNSEYIYENEIKIAIERHQNNKALVVPIMLRKCDIEYTPFKNIQGLPKDLEPINSNKWYTIDDAYFDVVEGLKLIIHRERNKREVFITEEKEWEIATKKNTVEAYLSYLENSKLKTKLEEVLDKVNQLKLDNYKFEVQFQNIELEIQQRERSSLAKELHDNVGGLLYMAQHLIKSLDKSNEVAMLINQNIDEALNAIRKISYSLVNDNSKNDFSLKKSILDLESSFMHSEKLKLEISFNNIDNFNNTQLEINIYRIIQELLSNILSHSNANKAFISISKTSTEIILKVIDNGIGFQPQKQTDKYRGQGLENIKSRIDYYNGKIEIKTEEDKGVVVLISIPL